MESEKHKVKRSIMKPMQKPLPTCPEGEWWATMEEVFHTD